MFIEIWEVMLNAVMLNTNGIPRVAQYAMLVRKWDTLAVTAPLKILTGWVRIFSVPSTAGQVPGPPQSNPTNCSPPVKMRLSLGRCRCRRCRLLDTGSQVTLFGESVCNEFLKHKELRGSEHLSRSWHVVLLSWHKDLVVLHRLSQT